ncbi:MAG TPA: TonB-dependent receptor [Caulobacteraceae bacterium]|jgi:outer membrane receptor protein involved in Fe transport|nr:TonB-dependent receptor [Caulobacteraceae bacterium]
MICSRTVAAGLFVTTALTSVLVAQGALAQEAAASAANAAGSSDVSLLSDVVVTATRQADTVNRVPLSISAVTQKALDQQGIKTVSDLQRSVPALTVSGIQGGVATFSLRGIVQSGPVTATTGVYLDDIPLQKRNTTGVQQNNGTPTPPLFDLERVEVLRGPQGTLYGGSSEGGTIRFIEPAPSLVRYSGQARAEVNHTQYGGTSYEGGLAFGGPIIQDKLGIRATVFQRHTAGYIDLVDPYTNTVAFPDVNSTEANAYRIAVLFSPMENFRATLSYYNNYNRQRDTVNAYLKPLNRQLTVPSACYAQLTTPSVSSVPPSIACPATAVPGQTVNGVYMRPAQTYGPFNFDKFQNVLADPAGPQGSTTKFNAPSLTLDYDFPKMTVRSVTSYISDLAKAHGYEQPQVGGIDGYTDRQGNFYNPGETVRYTGTTAQTTTGANLFRQFPVYPGSFNSKSKRWGMIQELRFSSTGDPKPFSWVGGVYFSNIRANTNYELPEDTDTINRLLFGFPTSALRYTQQVNLNAGQTCANVDFAALGVPSNTPTLLRTVNGTPVCSVGLPQRKDTILTARDQRVKDIEVAAFGEANLWVTDKLRVTGGIRLSRVSYDFKQVFYGPASGFNVPTVANTGITTGSVNESPVTPKAGIQYQLNDDNMVYASAAKGFRPGGVNVPLPDAICGAGLALIGLTVFDAPTTYGSDSVWSYEAGGKFRLANRIQVNTSAFRIDWSNVQLNVSIPGCGPTFIQNAGSARSQGFDLQAAGRVFPGLTANVNLAYTDAQYTATATGPVPKNGTAATPVVQKGDKLPVPPWTANVGLQYDFGVGAYTAYVRGDWQFQSKFLNGNGPGVGNYAPDTRNVPHAQVVNLRTGITLKNFDVNAYVNNVFNSTDALSLSGGRGGCTPNTDAACGTFSTYNPFFGVTTYRPRTIGVQANYRY